MLTGQIEMTQKSSDQLLESLSALVDNEASELEVRRILKNVERNPEVRERWHRYNMIGAVLRKETNLHLGEPVDLAAGIAAALASEQQFTPLSETRNSAGAASEKPGAEEPNKPKAWFDLVAKSAVAASFAGALVLGFNVFGPATDSNSGGSLQVADSAPRAQAADPVVSSAPLGFDLPPLESRTVSNNSMAQSQAAKPSQTLSSAQADDLTDVATQSLLNELLIHHATRASANGSLGVMPFARVSQMQADKETK